MIPPEFVVGLFHQSIAVVVRGIRRGEIRNPKFSTDSPCRRVDEQPIADERDLRGLASGGALRNILHQDGARTCPVALPEFGPMHAIVGVKVERSVNIRQRPES